MLSLRIVKHFDIIEHVLACKLVCFIGLTSDPGVLPRYYDPALGRFLSIDPVGFSPEMPFMFGRYTYVGNDPVNMWDPDGEQAARKDANGVFQMDPNNRSRSLSTQREPFTDVATAIGIAGVAVPLAVAGGAAAIAGACAVACSTIIIGAGAGAGFEGVNQVRSGEFNPGKLSASAAVGAAGGAGSLLGKQLATQAAGAFGTAALAGSAVEVLDQTANGRVDGFGVVIAGAKTGAGAAFGAGVGNLAGRALTGIPGFGGVGNLSSGGAALGAAVGEAASGTTVGVLDETLRGK